MLGVKPPEWTETDWLSWRRAGIGGSDVAALCGFSRFASPMSVFVDKCDLGAPREPTKAMKWGQIHEPNIARAFEDETGLFFLHPQTLAVDATHPWRRCTLDGLIAESPDVSLVDRGGFLGTGQIKCSSDYGWDELPEEVAVQILWEMGVAGFDNAWVPVLHQGNKDRIYGPFPFNERAFDALCSIADRFFHDHVKTQSPPRSDGSAATTEALKAAFSDGTGDPVELPEEVLDAAIAWPSAKQRVKDAEADVARIENELRLALGDHIAGGVRDEHGEITPILTWKPQVSARIDTKALKQQQPAIAAQFTKESTSRVLRQTKALAELIGTNEGANA